MNHVRSMLETPADRLLKPRSSVRLTLAIVVIIALAIGFAGVVAADGTSVEWDDTPGYYVDDGETLTVSVDGAVTDDAEVTLQRVDTTLTWTIDSTDVASWWSGTTFWFTVGEDVDVEPGDTFAVEVEVAEDGWLGDDDTTSTEWFEVREPDIEGDVELESPDGTLYNGDTAELSLTIENTGEAEETFHYGTSLGPQTSGETYIEETDSVTLSPGEDTTVTYDTTVEDDWVEDDYRAGVNLWETSDTDELVDSDHNYDFSVAIIDTEITWDERPPTTLDPNDDFRVDVTGSIADAGEACLYEEDGFSDNELDCTTLSRGDFALFERVDVDDLAAAPGEETTLYWEVEEDGWSGDDDTTSEASVEIEAFDIEAEVTVDTPDGTLYNGDTAELSVTVTNTGAAEEAFHYGTSLGPQTSGETYIEETGSVTLDPGAEETVTYDTTVADDWAADDYRAGVNLWETSDTDELVDSAHEYDFGVEIIDTTIDWEQQPPERMDPDGSFEVEATGSIADAGEVCLYEEDGLSDTQLACVALSQGDFSVSETVSGNDLEATDGTEADLYWEVSEDGWTGETVETDQESVLVETLTIDGSVEMISTPTGEIAAGDEVAISFTVENTGDTEATFRYETAVEAQTADESYLERDDDVTLAPGETTTVSYSTSVGDDWYDGVYHTAISLWATDDDSQVAAVTGDGFSVTTATAGPEDVEASIVADSFTVDADGVHEPGDVIAATVDVENTGDEPFMFFVGYSARGPNDRLYDNQGTTGQAVELAPGETRTVEVEWGVPGHAPEGSYDFLTAVWEDYPQEGMIPFEQSEWLDDAITVENPDPSELDEDLQLIVDSYAQRDDQPVGILPPVTYEEETYRVAVYLGDGAADWTGIKETSAVNRAFSHDHEVENGWEQIDTRQVLVFRDAGSGYQLVTDDETIYDVTATTVPGATPFYPYAEDVEYFEDPEFNDYRHPSDEIVADVDDLLESYVFTPQRVEQSWMQSEEEKYTHAVRGMASTGEVSILPETMVSALTDADDAEEAIDTAETFLAEEDNERVQAVLESYIENIEQVDDAESIAQFGDDAHTILEVLLYFAEYDAYSDERIEDMERVLELDEQRNDVSLDPDVRAAMETVIDEHEDLRQKQINRFIDFIRDEIRDQAIDIGTKSGVAVAQEFGSYTARQLGFNSAVTKASIKTAASQLGAAMLVSDYLYNMEGMYEQGINAKYSHELAQEYDDVADTLRKEHRGTGLDHETVADYRAADSLQMHATAEFWKSNAQMLNASWVADARDSVMGAFGLSDGTTIAETRERQHTRGERLHQDATDLHRPDSLDRAVETLPADADGAPAVSLPSNVSLDSTASESTTHVSVSNDGGSTLTVLSATVPDDDIAATVTDPTVAAGEDTQLQLTVRDGTIDESFSTVVYVHTNTDDAPLMLPVAATAGGDTGQFNITAVEPSGFAAPGDTVTVEAVVENAGATSDTQPVNASIPDLGTHATKQVSLEDGDTETINISLPTDGATAGSYDVRLTTAADTDTTTITVGESPGESLAVSVTPAETQVAAGNTTSFEIYAMDVDAGISTANFTLTTDDPGLASISDADRAASHVAEVTIAEDGSWGRFEQAFLETRASDDLLLGTVTVQTAAESVGTATLDVSEVTITDADGVAYETTTLGASLRVEPEDLDSPTIQAYADDDGVVRIGGVLAAINDYGEGEIGIGVVLDVVNHYSSGDPVS